MRANKHNVAHYTDDISGCGDEVLAAIRKEFFKVIKAVVTKIKSSQSQQELIPLLNALIWNYKGSDLSYLADY